MSITNKKRTKKEKDNLQHSKYNCTTGTSIIQKRQQLFREYVAAQRKAKSIAMNSKSEPIDIDLLPSSARNDNASKPWVKELNLFERDKNILLSKNEWLSDDILNAAQHLLKGINPLISGFQSTACGVVLNFSCETSEFVQNPLWRESLECNIKYWSTSWNSANF